MNKISFEKFKGKKVVEINEMYPILIFDGGETLTIESPWRLRNEKTILLGSSEYQIKENHGVAHEKFLSMMLGQEVSDIKITSNVSDLIITFRNGLSLEVLSVSGIYEGWILADGKDFILVSLPGGKSSLFGK